MRADAMAEPYPVTTLETDALEVARLLAKERLPGIVVTDADGRPHSILGAAQVVRFLVPSYMREDPSLAAVVDESFADRAADALSGVPVGRLLTERPVELPVVAPDDTILEVAATMDRTRCPLVAVVVNDQVTGVVTASRLLEFALLKP